VCVCVCVSYPFIAWPKKVCKPMQVCVCVFEISMLQCILIALFT